MNQVNDDTYITNVDFLKFMGALAMVFTHCYIFIYRLLPSQVYLSQTIFLNKIAYFNGLYSLILPAVAGVVFRDTLTPYFHNQKIKNLPSSKLLKSCLALMILESLKAAITFGFKYSFRWDVLHFIGLSFYLLSLILIYSNLKTVYLLCFIIMGTCLGIEYLKDHYYLNLSLSFADNSITLYIFYSCLFTSCIYFFYKLYRPKKLKAKLSLFAFLLIFIQFSLTYFKDTEFQIILANLPLSLLIQFGQYGGHIWPIFPWIILIFMGFILRDWQIRGVFNIKQRLAIVFIFFTTFLYFFIFHFQRYTQLLTKTTFFSPLYFIPNTLILFQILSFFICVFYLYDYIFSYLKWRNQMIKEISSGILIFYIIHLFLAWKLLPQLFRLIPVPYFFYAYPVTIFLLSYALLSGFLVVSNKLIWFQFKKNNN
ncbi:MAG: hypothetical protein AB7I27_09055 [Bacteriovoracaceae bacterium]